jgi:group I intron endonuclease
MEETPLIYKITSPSNRVYIGQTINLKKRLKAYIGLRCKRQIRLHLSFVKYGFENHKIEVIEYCTELDLNNRERYWQDYYDVLSVNGLNCRLTGSFDKSGKLSNSTIDKLKKKDIAYMIGNNFRTGVKHTKEIKEQISNTLIENSKKPNYINGMSGMVGDLNPFFGKKHSEKTKSILRKKALEKTDIIECLKSYNIERRHLLLDTQTGVYYESIREASKILCIKNSTLKFMLSDNSKNKTNLIKV